MGNRNTRGVGPEGAEAHKRALKPVTLGESGQKGQRPTRERSNQCFSVSGRPRRKGPGNESRDRAGGVKTEERDMPDSVDEVAFQRLSQIPTG
eukprot:1182473-Prorocentrum_minimum.AAC.1